MERVALYARVSTEEQHRRGLSLTEQERVLEDYANAHNMRIVGRYIDGGKSARKKYTTRPEFMRLLSDVEADKLDTILFIKLDRWFRNVGDYYEVQTILDAHNVTWRATQEDYETVTASGRFKVNIMLAVAQDEADRTSERIKFVFDGKRERGEPAGGRLPKGYKREDKKAVLDPETAPLVRKAFDVYLETGSYAAATRACPELHLTYNTARRMFDNRTYMGDYYGVPVPPLITEEEHERALALHGHIVRKTKDNRVYLFTGLLVCPYCGRRLGSKVVRHPGDKEYYYYVCPRKYRDSICENKKHYSEAGIEAYLLDNVDSKLAAQASTQEESHAISYKPQRDAIKRKLEKLSELYMAEMIDMEDYKRKYAALNAELAAVPEDVNPKKLEAVNMFAGNWRDVYDGLSKSSRRTFWRSCIDTITLDNNSVADFSLR